MPFTEERPPLASETELRALYAMLPPERANAMTDALDVLADLETHQHRFPAWRVKTALAEHGFAYLHTTPHHVEVWAPTSAPATYDRGAVVVPDPERGFGDVAVCISQMLWALSRVGGIGMVEATARVLAAVATETGLPSAAPAP